MAGMLSPSVMCADLLHLYDEIERLVSLGVEFLHIDFMDNKFVPNITFDTNMVRSFKKPMKNIRRDIHLMAYEPQQFFDAMEISAGDMVSVHFVPDIFNIKCNPSAAKTLCLLNPVFNFVNVGVYVRNNNVF